MRVCLQISPGFEGFQQLDGFLEGFGRSSGREAGVSIGGLCHKRSEVGGIDTASAVLERIGESGCWILLDCINLNLSAMFIIVVTGFFMAVMAVTAITGTKDISSIALTCHRSRVVSYHLLFFETIRAIIRCISIFFFVSSPS